MAAFCDGDVQPENDISPEGHVIKVNEAENTLMSVASLVNPSVKDEVEKCLNDLTTEFDDTKETVKTENWLEWAGRLNYLKQVTTEIPDFILPKHCSGELIDVKVFTKHGPDDKIYDENKKVRDRVARGNCFMRITKGPHKGSRCALYALKKFTGGLGDDDDKDRGDNFTWKKYFIKPIDTTKRIVCTRKANGEAAHLSCVRIDSQILICAGSKNVHMLIRNKGDIAFYRGDRYRIAAEICHTIMDNLDEMETEQKERLLSFLATTRLTAVFEILSPLHQHVEDLSSLDRPVLKFITWTKTELEPPPEQQLCTIAPHIGIEIARALSLDAVEYDIISMKDVEGKMKQIRQGYLYEGEVLYFLDENDCVIGLLKKKTIWYIVCRALREKARNSVAAMMKNRSTFSVTKSVQQVEKRLKEIQKWLGLSDEATSQWKALGISFIKWCVSQVEQGELCIADIGDKFPGTWKKHLEMSGYSDRIEVECLEESVDFSGDLEFAGAGV